jgi:hypothetical protein
VTAKASGFKIAATDDPVSDNSYSEEDDSTDDDVRQVKSKTNFKRCNNNR